jgi:Fe-Mn family superoxide dismutase
MRRLNAITEKLDAPDFSSTPGYIINGLKREELVALNSTLLHELYFASLGGDGTRPTPAMREALARDFGSYERWCDEFLAMGYALAGGSGWVLLTYIPRDGRLMNEYGTGDTQAEGSGVAVRGG